MMSPEEKDLIVEVINQQLRMVENLLNENIDNKRLRQLTHRKNLCKGIIKNLEFENGNTLRSQGRVQNL